MAFNYAALSDLTTAESISGEFLMLLAARDGGALLSHPALVYAGAVNGRGSSVITTPHLGLDGYDLFATASDGAEITATDPTFGSTQITVVRKGLRYTPTDLAKLTDATGVINAQRFARSMFVGATETLVSMIAALGGGFSQTAGTSGADMTVQDFLDAKGVLLDNNVNGPLCAILHPRQFTDWTNDLALNGSGSLVYHPAAPDLLAKTGDSYKGNFAGVDIFTTTRVPASGGNRQGMMFGRGAIVWADGSAPMDDAANQVMLGRLLFERERHAAFGTTDWVGQLYLGVAEGIDLAGVGIITDQ